MITVEGRTPLITGSSCLGMLAVGANGTAIMAALPTIRRDRRPLCSSGADP
jgi:hypothetical protein